LTMRTALRSIFAHAAADAAAAGVPESWWAPISASPRRDVPRSAALSSTGEECASTSDALVATSPATGRTNRLRAPSTDASLAARTAFPQSPVKGFASARLEAPSIDECPLDSLPLSRPRISNASPPPVFGFCRPESGFRRSFAASLRRGRWLDRDRYRTLFTFGRFWPRAARRLLQSKRSASTTYGPRNPDSLGRIRFHEFVSRRLTAYAGPASQSKPPDLRRTASSYDVRSPLRRCRHRFYPITISIEWEPRIHGSGAVWCVVIRRSPRRPPSTTIACLGGFAPTRLARTPHVALPASTTIGAP